MYLALNYYEVLIIGGESRKLEGWFVGWDIVP